MSDPGTVDFLVTKNFRAGSLVAYWALKSRIIRTCAIAFHKWVRYTVVTNAVENMGKQMNIETPTSAKAGTEAEAEPFSSGSSVNKPSNGEDDVMSDEMEKLRQSNRGVRNRRQGIIIPTSLTVDTTEARVAEDNEDANGGSPKPVADAMTPHLEKTVAAANALVNKGNYLSVDTEAIAASVGRSLKAASRSKEEKKLDAFAAAVQDAIVDGKRNLLLSLARDIISGAGMTTSSLSLLSHSMALEEMDSYARVGAATPGSGRRQSVGSRPYLQNSYSKPKGETGASVSAGPGSTTLLLSDRDSVDAPPASSSNANDIVSTSATGPAHLSVTDILNPERGRKEKPLPVRRRSGSAVPLARTSTVDLTGSSNEFPPRPRRSNSVSPARRRWRRKQQEEAQPTKRIVQHQHSAQYQRVQLMRQMKAQTEAELKKASSELDSGPVRRSSSFVPSTSAATERGRSSSVYAFGSSTFSEKNVANVPVSAVRNDIIYNRDHYQHSAVTSSGYGTVPALHHSATIDKQIGRATGMNGRPPIRVGSLVDGPNPPKPVQASSNANMKRTASYMQPTHASDKRIVEAIKERTLSPAIAPGQGPSWFSAKAPSPVSRSSSGASLSRLGENDTRPRAVSTASSTATSSPQMQASESIKYRPGKAQQPPVRNKLHMERQAQGVLPLRTDKPPPGMERAQWLLMMGINPHHANNLKRSR